MRIYLCAPYTSPDPDIMEVRHRLITRKAAELMRDGHNVFSPIDHSVGIEGQLKKIGVKTDFDFWMNQDLSFIHRWADEVWVLCLPGWDKSPGVHEEIKMAQIIGISFKFITMECH